MEDLAIPRLHLSVYESAVYSHLLRHSRLEGKLELRFSLQWLARSAVRSLAAKGALRLVERSRAGHLVEVRLPEEIRAVRAGKSAAGREVRPAGADNLEEVDFLETKELREAIHRREGGRCFYCLHRVTRMTRCLDHVVPRARNGSNRYRNVVSACVECNSQKRERPAPDFLRWLFREGRLDGAELKGRQRALKALAAGKLRPRIEEVRK
jgi:HNH endonuclease